MTHSTISVPYTELDNENGYNNSTAAHSAAKKEVKRLLPTKNEPKMDEDYTITKRDDRFFVGLMKNALLALKDQPVTFVFQQKGKTGTVGYLTEEDQFPWPEFKDYVKSIENYRLVTMQCRPSLISIINKDLKNGSKWVPLEKHFEEVKTFMESHNKVVDSSI